MILRLTDAGCLDVNLKFGQVDPPGCISGCKSESPKKELYKVSFKKGSYGFPVRYTVQFLIIQGGLLLGVCFCGTAERIQRKFGFYTGFH